MKKVILNTNVILSALIHKGVLKDLLDYVSTECIVYISPPLINEVKDKLKNRFNANLELFNQFLTIVSFAQLFSPPIKVNFSTDPDDAFLLELAEASMADYLITGDKKHLLPLKKWYSTKIISPSDFMKEVKKQS